MPIPDNTIQPLLNAVQSRPLAPWKKEYFKKVARGLQVHTKGQLFSKVDTLFPNEHPDSKAHCLATYEPITKSSIWKGINNLNRIFSNSAFTINTGDELRAYLEEYSYEGMNLLTHFLDLWVHKAVAEDPHGLFVVYPPEYAEERDMCPVQFVRSEFIKAKGRLADGTEFVAFTSEHDSEVSYTMEHVVTHKEIFYDPDVEKMNARTCTETTYNERLCPKVVKDVVHVFTPGGFVVYEPVAKGAQTFRQYDFAEDLSALPAFPGGGVLVDRADVPLFESFVAPFIPFGNLALLQHRNHRAVDLQFSYPRMSELQTPCDELKCVGGKIKGKKTTEHPDGLVDCKRCRGTGFVTVQSPYKSYARKYDPNDAGENKHLTVPPVEFYAPDVAIIDYSKDAWKNYLKMAEEAIFITQKVMTGQVQSAESKNVDLDDLYAWLLNVSKVFYNNLRAVLQAFEDYLAPSPMTCTVEKPYSFAILTEEEAFVALNGILTSDAPVFVKGDRVDNFVNKFVSKTSPIVKALTILKQYDPLLFYTTADIQTFKGAGVVTQDMWTRHALGYPVLLKLYEQDRTIFDQATEAIMATMDAEIAKFKIPPAGAGFKQAILDGLNPPVPAA